MRTAGSETRAEQCLITWYDDSAGFVGDLLTEA